MDRWTTLAFAVLLDVISTGKAARKVYPQLAKVFVKIELLASLDPLLSDYIAKQREKEASK